MPKKPELPVEKLKLASTKTKKEKQFSWRSSTV